jgi:cyclophilin family peptidyl-prolyl cis-trans isomerase
VTLAIGERPSILMSMRRQATVLFLLIFLAMATTAASAFAVEPALQKQQFLSQVYTIDKKYRSMEGPSSMERVYLGDPGKPELLWVTGVHTEMVGEDGKTPQLPELMCHVNVDLDALKHQALFGLKRYPAARLITLSQGMIDARLPEGFGFPIASTEPIILYTQVLNHNIEQPNNMKVRHRVTFEYIRDRDLEHPLKPLFNVGASGTVLLQDPTALAMMPAADTKAIEAGGGGHGASCLMAARAPNANAGGADYVDPQGRHLTGHWVVPPGKQVNHSDITWFMGLPYDTTLHYAAAHLHPYAKSLLVRDLTTGKTLFEADAVGPEKGIGLAKVDTFTSAAGVPMYRDHKYELVSVYDNPTSENADSMASAFLALEDPEFTHPDPATLATRDAIYLESAQQVTAAVRTSAGDLVLTLDRKSAPEATRQFIHLVRIGAYDRAEARLSAQGAIEIVPTAMTDLQKSVLRKTPVESALKHTGGLVSLCPGSPTLTLLTTEDSSRNSRCTAFATIGTGADVLASLTHAPRDEHGAWKTAVTVTRVELYDSPNTAR